MDIETEEWIWSFMGINGRYGANKIDTEREDVMFV